MSRARGRYRTAQRLTVVVVLVAVSGAWAAVEWDRASHLLGSVEVVAVAEWVLLGSARSMAQPLTHFSRLHPAPEERVVDWSSLSVARSKIAETLLRQAQVDKAGQHQEVVVPEAPCC